MSTITTGNTTTNTIIVSGDTTGNLYIQTGTLTPALAMTVTNNQLVGIGTSSPSTYLQIGSSIANANAIITFGKTTSTTQATLPTIYCGSVIQSGTSPDLILQTGSTSGGVVLVTGGSLNNNLIYDSNGNLGLGTNTSSWNSYYKSVDIGQAGCLYSDTSYATAILGTNFYNGVSNAIYKQSSVGASKFVQYNGQFSWYNASSNTAGNPVSFTQAMTLDNSGRLLIGTTSANSNDYAGTIKAVCIINNGVNQITFSSLNNYYNLYSSAGFCGLIIARDDSSGGSAVYMFDPNVGTTTIASNLQNSIVLSFAYNSATTYPKVQQTAGTTGHSFSFMLIGNQ
jgi:hypothetical protein